MSDFLTISNANELIRIPAEGLAYIESEGNYSDIHTCDGGKRTVTVQLGILEEMIHRQFQRPDEFARIGKSLIVNLKLIHYINPAKRQLILSDCRTFRFELDASREALKKLKEYFEKERNNETF